MLKLEFVCYSSSGNGMDNIVITINHVRIYYDEIISVDHVAAISLGLQLKLWQYQFLSVAKAQVFGDLPTFTLRCRAHCWTFRRSRNRRQGQFLHENYWIVMDDGRLELKFQPVSFFALCFTSRFLPVLCMKIPVAPRPLEGTRVLAPCGFPLDDALAELQKEKQNLVKMLLELRFLEEMTVVVFFWGGGTQLEVIPIVLVTFEQMWMKSWSVEVDSY